MHEMEFVEMKFQVKSISLWQQLTKKSEIYKSQILSDLVLLLKIRHKKRKVWCLANSLRETFKKMCKYVWIQMKS